MTAFAYREYTLTCDHPGCRAAYGPWGVQRTRAALRNLAAKEGWTHVRDSTRRLDEDFCPDHKPQEG